MGITKVGEKTDRKNGKKPDKKAGMKAGIKTDKKPNIKFNPKAMIEWLLGICIIVGIVAVFFFARDLGFTAYANIPMGTNKNHEIELEIKAGDSITSIAELLEEEEMIASKEAFCLRSVFSQYHGLMKEGTYHIDETMGIDDILAVITQSGTQ